MSRRWQLLTALVVVAVAACSADGGSGPPYDVSSDVVGDARTQDIQVWAPVGKGTWPVVFAVPGISGHKSDFDRVGPALARRGVAVFAADYRTNGTADQMMRDLQCGYRLVRRVADEYGGDLTQPVTGLGYSFGATPVIGALQEKLSGPHGSQEDCLLGEPLPDVVVGVNGCYYSWQGHPQSFPVGMLDRRDAKILLVAAEVDQTCPAWQSRKASGALKDAGFDTSLVTIPAANHYTPVFHDVVDGEWVTVADAPAGRDTVRAVLEAIRSTRQREHG